MRDHHWARRARAFTAAFAAIGSLLAAKPAAAAQQTGVIEGTVVAAETGAPMEGVRVFIEGTETGALPDAAGRYRLTGVRAGSVVVGTEFLGRRGERRTVSVGTAAAATVDFRLDVEALAGGELIVSASREAQRKSETPATIGVITGDQIKSTHPSHPSEIMNRIPGVYINVTGGEGHMAAIRNFVSFNV
jgi:iron complex outermembrane receptor protein